MKMHAVKDHVGAAKHVIHIALDVAILHQYPVYPISQRIIVAIADIEIQRILTPQQPDALKLYTVAVGAQRHALMGTAVHRIQQAVGDSQIIEL